MFFATGLYIAFVDTSVLTVCQNHSHLPRRKSDGILPAECTEGASDEGTSDKELPPEVCNCGLDKEFCSVDGCLSTYCPEADFDAADDKIFYICDGCDKVHCANHDFWPCVGCDEIVCYADPSHCRFCDEVLCENCQSAWRNMAALTQIMY